MNGTNNINYITLRITKLIIKTVVKKAAVEIINYLNTNLRGI
jgi:hypothetical protein